MRLLVELGSPAAIDGMKKVVTGPYDAMLRMSATGLYKSDNSSLACQLALPLLKSPYGDVRQDAALTLGRGADARGQKVLEEILANANNSAPLRAAAAWYLLRIQHKTADAAKELAKGIK